MAASTSGAIKALLEAAGLGISVYRDQAPSGQALPYVTVSERITLTKSLAGRGDFGDASADTVVEEQVQVDVWQRWKDPVSGAIAESYTLADAVAAALDGAQLTAAPKLVNGVRLTTAVRFIEEDTNVVHDAITVVVHRRL